MDRNRFDSTLRSGPVAGLRPGALGPLYHSRFRYRDRYRQTVGEWITRRPGLPAWRSPIKTFTGCPGWRTLPHWRKAVDVFYQLPAHCSSIICRPSETKPRPVWIRLHVCA